MIHIDLMHWRHVSITTTPCWGSRLVALHARAVLEERWLSVGARARAGPAVWHCRGWPAGCMLGDGACDSASFDPQHAGAPFCDVICIRSIRNQYWTIHLRIQSTKSNLSAVYTGIRKPESFSHSGFLLKVARQLPLNTPKTRIEKPTSAAWFFETPPKFHWFFANVNARSNLADIIRVFGHVVRDLQRNHATYCALHVYGQR